MHITKKCRQQETDLSEYYVIQESWYTHEISGRIPTQNNGFKLVGGMSERRSTAILARSFVVKDKSNSI